MFFFGLLTQRENLSEVFGIERNAPTVSDSVNLAHVSCISFRASNITVVTHNIDTMETESTRASQSSQNHF